MHKGGKLEGEAMLKMGTGSAGHCILQRDAVLLTKQGHSIYICSKVLIMKGCFNVSQGPDETLQMLLLRKKW